MNILVVDDDREIVDSICIFLTGEGYKAFKAYDGIEALEILSENDIHLMNLQWNAKKEKSFIVSPIVDEKSIFEYINSFVISHDIRHETRHQKWVNIM